MEVLLVMAVLALGGWLLLPAMSEGRIASKRQACLQNLGAIGKAIHSYLGEHDHRWPFVAKLASAPVQSPPWPTLPTVLEPYLGRDAAVFKCPADRRILSKQDSLYARFGAQTTYHETEGLSYEWWFSEAYGGKKVGEESLRKAGGFGLGRADQPLLTDFEPFHVGDEQGAMNTLNADLKPRTTRAKTSQ